MLTIKQLLFAFLLQRTLQCVVRLCAGCPQLTDRYVDSIITSLVTMPEPSAVALCECLAAISSHQTDLLHNLLPELISVITAHLQDGRPANSKLVVSSFIVEIITSYHA